MTDFAILHVLLCLFKLANARQIVQRGEGCSEFPSHTITIANKTFSILCNSIWDGSLYLNVIYTNTFSSCVQACVDWDGETPCIGAQWDHSTSGYKGGNLCHLLWDMPSNRSTFNSEVDSAKLNIGPPPVCPYQRFLLTI